MFPRTRHQSRCEPWNREHMGARRTQTKMEKYNGSHAFWRGMGRRGEGDDCVKQEGGSRFRGQRHSLISSTD